MNSKLPFPAVPDPDHLLGNVLSCGQGKKTVDEAYAELVQYFGSFLPSTSCKLHAEIIGVYVGSLLVGFFGESKAEMLDRAIKGWAGVNECQAQASDLPSYQANPDSHNYAILSLICHLASHAKGKSKKNAERAKSSLLVGPLARWIDKSVIFAFDEEDWRTSKPKP